MEQVDMSPKVAAILLKPGKDSRWLTLEVCREFAREACPRSEEECKYAHPPSHVEVQNGKVICCFDFIKSKCQRNNPPCKYLHPPSHLKEQLLETGRQNLIVKNLQLQSALSSGLLQPVLAGSSIPLVASSKTVIPSAYQAMLLPGQQPYATTGSPYVIPSPSPVMPQYQILGSAQGAMPGYHNGLVQVLNSAQYANIIPFNVFNNQHSYPFQVMPYLDSMQPTMDASLKINQPTASQLHAYESSSEEKSSGNGLGRKRVHEVQTGTFAPPLKRTALVDAKSGLPVYAQVPAPQLSLASVPVQQPQYFPISLTPHTTLLQRF